jgi:hypothetical protein
LYRNLSRREWIESLRSSVRVARICDAFSIIVPFDLRGSLGATRCRISGDARRVSRDGQSLTLLGDCGGHG